MASPKTQYLVDQTIRQTVDLCGQLFDTSCCKKVINELELTDPACMKLFTAKLLGYGIIVGASLVKLPQVIKIFNAKSGAGITLFGVLLELMAITFNACYSLRNNFPFSAWGEAIFLAIETALIAFLILWYDGSKKGALAYISAYVALISALVHPSFIAKNVVWWLQSSVLPLAVTGKMIQAFKNYKAQHTGQISAVTAWSILAGSLARIFTTIQETGDILTAVTFACAASANAILALQVAYYWKSTEKFLKKKKN